jgi:hypothetical protein
MSQWTVADRVGWFPKLFSSSLNKILLRLAGMDNCSDEAGGKRGYMCKNTAYLCVTLLGPSSLPHPTTPLHTPKGFFFFFFHFLISKNWKNLAQIQKEKKKVFKFTLEKKPKQIPKFFVEKWRNLASFF